MRKINLLKKQILSVVLLLLSLQVYPQAAPGEYEGVMLQAFYWDSYNNSSMRWTGLTSQATEIAQSFDLVWLPPSGLSQGMGYHPVHYFNQNSAFGSPNELKTLISTLKAKGCGAIADIVINHRNGVYNWADFPVETYKGVTYTWDLKTICRDDEVVCNAGYSCNPNDYGAPEQLYCEGWDGARDLDHTNPLVKNTIKAYLDFMKNEMGYVGWRYDFVKGFPAYSVADYNLSAGNQFSVGECYDASYDVVTGWVDATIWDNQIRSGAFDFPLKFAMNQAFNGGNWSALSWTRNGQPQPAGMIHMDGFRRFAYTFVDNHDTHHDNGSKLHNYQMAANAFLLCHPGIPVVFYKHWEENKIAIKDIISLRKNAGIHSQSTVNVLATASDIYAAEIFGKYGSLVVKVGPRYNFNPPAGYQLRASGDYYAVWSNGGLSPSLSPAGIVDLNDVYGNEEMNEKDAPVIYTGKSFLRIELPEEAQVSILSVDGKMIEQKLSGSMQFNNLESGVYVIKINERSHKVVVE